MRLSTVVFLGLGHLQRHAVIAAKRNGFYTIGFDRNPKAPSLADVDEFYSISALDYKEIAGVLTSKSEIKVVTIWANNDIFIGCRAKLEEVLNVRHARLGLEDCLSALNKKKFKKEFESGNFIKSLGTEDIDYSKSYIKKPLNGSGSSGVSICSAAEAIEYVGRGFVIEEYVHGVEYVLNCWADEVGVRWYETFLRYFDYSEDFVPRGTAYSGLFEQSSDVLKAKKILVDFISDNQLRGLLKFDVLVAPDSAVYIIEFSARYHGEVDTSYALEFAGYPSIAERHFLSMSENVCSMHKEAVLWSESCGYFSVFPPIDKHRLLEYFQTIVKKISLPVKTTGVLEGRGDPVTKELSTANIKWFVFYAADRVLESDEFLYISRLLNERSPKC